MDFETLERMWMSPDNAPSQAVESGLMNELLTMLESRRRRFGAFMVFAGLMLSLLTLLAAFAVVVHRVIDLRHEWALPLMLAAPWTAFVVFGLQYRRHLRACPEAGRSLRESAAALLDENLTARKRAHTMAVIQGVFAGLIVVVLRQLVEAGKMEPRQGLQAGLLFAGVLLLSALVQAAVYFRVLRPKGRQLERLLGEFSNKG